MTKSKAVITYSEKNGVTYVAHPGHAPQPLVDAKSDLDLPISRMNRKMAKSDGNLVFTECVLANALNDQPDVIWAVVFRSMAFVGYADKVVHYEVPLATRREIVLNDVAPATLKALGVTYRPAKSVRLKAPRLSKTIVGKRETMAKHKTAKALGLAKVTGPNGVTNGALATLGVRKGAGAIATT